MLAYLKIILKVSAVFPYDRQTIWWQILRLATILIIFLNATIFISAAVIYSIKFQRADEIIKAAGYTYNYVIVNMLIYGHFLFYRKSLKQTIQSWEDQIQISNKKKHLFLQNFNERFNRIQFFRNETKSIENTIL